MEGLMFKKLLFGCGAGLMALALAVPAAAQTHATIVMRDGSRQSGDLVDLNAQGFELRTNGESKHIDKNDVAAVEFVEGGVPAEAQDRVNNNQPVVVLRSGEVVNGDLTDVGGASPLRLTVNTDSGSKDYTSDQVARIYFHNTSGTTASASNAPQRGTLAVQATREWTDTGMRVNKGQRLTFNASGEIRIADDKTSTPGGNADATAPNMKYPVFNAPAGALIARVGNGQPFLIGANSQAITMPDSGELQLGVNDNHFPDNGGAYSVQVQRVGE
jgi:hypothetical protein